MFQTMVIKELKSILLSPKFTGTFAVCTLLMLLTVYVGIREYQSNLKEYAAANNLVQQEMRIANRLGRDAVLFLVDMDDLKVINDRHGHHAGDQAIRDTADILRRSFRESDVLSRIGGDEFVIFMIEHSDVDPGTLARRLQDILRIFNSQTARPYVLSLSIGWTRYEAGNPSTIDELMRQADAFMYERKRTRTRTFP